MGKIARREFLKVAPASAGLAALVAGNATAFGDAPRQPGANAVVKISGTGYTPAGDYPIRPKRHSEVTLTDTFWKSKVATNARVTIPFEVEKLSAMERGFGGNVLEAAILSLQTHPNAALQTQVEARVQQLKSNPSRGNSGYEVAATYYNATGKRDLLDQAIASADALYSDFAANDRPFSGGERDAINCIQLYRVTHDKKHLDLAKHYLDIRGLPNSVNRSRHNQSYKPVVEQTEAVGHAVNCVSLIVSLIDVGTLTGITAYADAAHRMWRDIVERKLYITGGVGTTGNEGFGEPYSLPNISAYSETCAVLMFITLNHRMFMATGDSKYVDVMERGMYNNALSGVSTSGNRFFYVNRLASAGDGRDTRWERASLECCPPNLVRFLASMPGLVYAQDQKGAIYVNLYVSSQTAFTIGASELGLSVESDMPWGGKTTIAVSTKQDVNGVIKLRIPGWARNQPVPGSLYRYRDTLEKKWTVAVNGKGIDAVVDPTGYLSLDRRWKNGDVVAIEFPMEIRRVVADARVKEDQRKMAVERGPIVYCSESPGPGTAPVLNLLFDAAGELKVSAAPSFEGAPTIEAKATSLNDASAPAKTVTLIPYHLWANRGAGEMSVWVSTSGYALGDVGPAGGFIFYENPNYAKDGWRYLEAAPFDQSAGAQWGCFRQMIPGARGTEVGTGKKNTADMLAACADPGTAAALCAHLSVNGVRGWFLPSRDELALMYRNLKAGNTGDFRDGGVADNFTYWASSQQTADMAVHIDFADLGRLHGDDKDFPRRVRAIRMI
jgi:uncharacterized protein